MYGGVKNGDRERLPGDVGGDVGGDVVGEIVIEGYVGGKKSTTITGGLLEEGWLTEFCDSNPIAFNTSGVGLGLRFFGRSQAAF